MLKPLCSPCNRHRNQARGVCFGFGPDDDFNVAIEQRQKSHQPFRRKAREFVVLDMHCFVARSYLLTGDYQRRHFVPVKLKVGCNVAENRRECPDFQCIVRGNSDVMFAVAGCGQPDMATGLTADLVSESTRCLGQLAT